MSNKHSVDISEIIDWIDENQPVYGDKLRDAFGVNDLLDVDADELLEVICDDDRLYELLTDEFSADIFSATNTVSISPSLDIITGESDEADTLNYYEDLMEEVDAALESYDATSTYHESIDNIYLIVYSSKGTIHEFQIPKSDLIKDIDKDTDYIIEAALGELDIW
jgi:hypothetical protein